MEKILVTAVSGHSFFVDPSPEACAPFDVQHNGTYYHPSLGHGTVIGVAHELEWRESHEQGSLTVWVAFEADRGKVSNILYTKEGA